MAGALRATDGVELWGRLGRRWSAVRIEPAVDYNKIDSETV